MIRGAIFDLDGVLLDSLGIWKDLGIRYLRQNGITPEPGLSEILFPMSMEQGAEYLKSHYPLAQSTERIQAAISRLLEDYYFYEVQAKEGAKELLEFLQAKEVKMVAATSSPREHVTKALERNGLLQYLKGIYTTSEVGKSKYSPKIYQMAAESLQTSYEETFVFEDSYYALKTAKDVGFRVVAVYDKDGETDQQGIMGNSEVYLKKLEDFSGIWLQINR